MSILGEIENILFHYIFLLSTGRRCPHSDTKRAIWMGPPPKRSQRRGQQTQKLRSHIKNIFSGQNPVFLAQQKNHFLTLTISGGTLLTKYGVPKYGVPS